MILLCKFRIVLKYLNLSLLVKLNRSKTTVCLGKFNVNNLEALVKYCCNASDSLFFVFFCLNADRLNIFKMYLLTFHLLYASICKSDASNT